MSRMLPKVLGLSAELLTFRTYTNEISMAKNINVLNVLSSGIEDNPTVFYQMIRGSTDQTNKYDTFYLQQRHENSVTYADIKVNHPTNG